jgi:exodeoxyribonuclease-3
MRIITWNCNMAFRKKAEAILALEPDILVLPECECAEKLVFKSELKQPSSILWFGSNKHKGLAVIAYNGIKLKAMKDHNPNFKTIAPIAVNGPGFRFTLFAIWANNPDDPDGQYAEQVWKAVNYYEHLLKPRRIILAGDFNSNTIWDKNHRMGSHSAIVRFLQDKKICSAYHLHHGQAHGSERHPTFYLYRHQQKPYHLDYCFVSRDIARRLTRVEIGGHEEWSAYSDHVPVIMSFEWESRKKSMVDPVLRDGQ